MVGHWWKLHRSTRHHHRRRPTFWCRRKRCRITHHRPNRRVFCTRATNNIHTMPNWLNTNRWPSSMSVHLPQHHRRDQAKCHCPYRRIINWWRRSAALSDRNHRSAICQHCNCKSINLYRPIRPRPHRHTPVTWHCCTTHHHIIIICIRFFQSPDVHRVYHPHRCIDRPKSKRMFIILSLFVDSIYSFIHLFFSSSLSSWHHGESFFISLFDARATIVWLHIEIHLRFVDCCLTLLWLCFLRWSPVRVFTRRLFLLQINSNQMLATTLSALYGKLLVVMGIAFPMAEVISTYIPPSFYEVSVVYIPGVFFSLSLSRFMFIRIRDVWRCLSTLPLAVIWRSQSSVTYS